MEGKNIYQRVAAVMHDVSGVEKTGTNMHARYKYAGHEAVTAALRGAYLRHGIVRQASVVEHFREGGTIRFVVEVSFVSVDNPEDRIVCRMVSESPPQTKSGAPTPQQSGVALSYAVKNVEFKLFCLTGDTEPDADEYHENNASSTGNGNNNGRQSHAPAVDVAALAAGLECAETRKQLSSVIAKVRRVARQLSEADRARLNDLRKEAIERVS